MNKIKAELQDMGFRALHPLRHKVIAKRIAAQPVMRETTNSGVNMAVGMPQ